MNTRTGYIVTTSHGIAECATCLRAADWAVTQIKIIGTAIGRDRIKDEHGLLHKAVARPTMKDEVWHG